MATGLASAAAAVARVLAAGLTELASSLEDLNNDEEIMVDVCLNSKSWGGGWTCWAREGEDREERKEKSVERIFFFIFDFFLFIMAYGPERRNLFESP